jgi:hypothetical protein
VPVHIGRVPGLPAAEAGGQDEGDPAAGRPPARLHFQPPAGAHAAFPCARPAVIQLATRILAGPPEAGRGLRRREQLSERLEGGGDIHFGPEPVVAEDRAGTAVQVSLDLGPLGSPTYQGRMGRKVFADELSGMPPGYFPVQPDGGPVSLKAGWPGWPCSPPAGRAWSVARRPRSGPGREGREGRGPGYGVHLWVVSPRTLAASSVRR